MLKQHIKMDKRISNGTEFEEYKFHQYKPYFNK